MSTSKRVRKSAALVILLTGFMFISYGAWAQGPPVVFDFNNLLGTKTTATLPPGSKLPFEEKNQIVVGNHTFLFPNPTAISPEVIARHNTELRCRSTGLYLENICSSNSISEVEMEIDYGNDYQLFISINGTKYFTAVVAGDQKKISGVDVTVATVVGGGQYTMTGKILFKGNISSIYIGAKVPPTELYFDKIDIK